MSPEIVVGAITGIATIVVAVVGAVGKIITARISTLSSSVGEVRAQVKNSHDTNLREELDERHAETAEWFKETRRDIGGLRSELRALREGDQLLDRRMQFAEKQLADLKENRS